MDIVKYFYEEPASLEVLTPDSEPDARRRDGPRMSLDDLLGGPRYYRGYLAGTNLDADRVGLTSLAHPDVFTEAIVDGLGPGRWTHGDASGTAREIEGPALHALLRSPEATTVLACGAAPLPGDLLAAAAHADRRRALSGLRRVLAETYVVLFPEPAHHGWDWSLFAARPMRPALTEALRRHRREGVRVFAVPFRRARSEEKFYFETWQLDAPLPDYIDEL